MSAQDIVLSPEESAELSRRTRSATISQRDGRRARVILLAAQGCSRVNNRTQSHDYIRHGTVTLFTALDYLEGKLISSIERQHRHQEWLDFLKKINREAPKHLQLHLIVD
ncbi:IS630 family transposase, partial [Pseudomonas syringae pv. actinidiae]|nr:IS630 family transposase [Pseudomonas syringae pv. actinidiae]